MRTTHMYIYMHICSLVPRPPPQLSSLAVRITLRTLSVIRTASDDSCGEGLGTRLAYLCLGMVHFHGVSNLLIAIDQEAKTISTRGTSRCQCMQTLQAFF